MKWLKNILVGVLLVLMGTGVVISQTQPLTTTACVVTPLTVTSTSQALVVANGLRRIIMIQNNAATAAIAMAFGSTTATMTHPNIPANSNYYASGAGIPTQAINLISNILSNATVAVMECS